MIKVPTILYRSGQSQSHICASFFLLLFVQHFIVKYHWSIIYLWRISKLNDVGYFWVSFFWGANRIQYENFSSFYCNTRSVFLNISLIYSDSVLRLSVQFQTNTFWPQKYHKFSFSHFIVKKTSLFIQEPLRKHRYALWDAE